MLNSIGRTLLTGLITILPIVLTLYLLYWLAISSENVMRSALHLIFPDLAYFPGLGMIVGMVVVFFVGLMMKAFIVRQLFLFSEQILYRLPLIKTIYRAMRDLFDFFTPKENKFGRVVTVNFNGMELIGFVTQEDTTKLPASFKSKEGVLVYIPMSYMIGGFTVLIPRKDIHHCSMSMDEAMQFVLTAGITGKKPNR
ncbi:MAG: DUF502 domain-containing protein [Burkholderiales bacterium]|nr:DUF502 domain-containing protein [Burkholderiales bacterium]MDR4516916.1 DUF502 domain-containing protein [Nitrosomonas sp.]